MGVMKRPSSRTHIGAYAADDDMVKATGEDGQPRLRVYRPARALVVLGRGSKTGVELDLPACLAAGVPIVRRRGGGCAVVLDPGNVVVSVTLPAEGLGKNKGHFKRISSWVIAGLDRAGFPGVRQDGISDLVLNDRKIAGACIYRTTGLLFYTASILAAPDISLMTSYLKHPPREPSYRCGRSHETFVTSLLDSDDPAAAEELAETLRGVLSFDDMERV